MRNTGTKELKGLVDNLNEMGMSEMALAFDSSSIVNPRERRRSNCSSIVLNAFSAMKSPFINKTPPSVHVLPQRPEGVVVYI